MGWNALINPRYGFIDNVLNAIGFKPQVQCLEYLHPVGRLYSIVGEQSAVGQPLMRVQHVAHSVGRQNGTKSAFLPKH